VAAAPQPAVVGVSLLRESACIDSLGRVDSRARGASPSGSLQMLDGKRYFAEFPDEDPEKQPRLLRSPELMASLKALEKELRPYLQNELTNDIDRK
jgi:hypothetical protein